MQEIFLGEQLALKTNRASHVFSYHYLSLARELRNIRVDVVDIWAGLNENEFDDG